MDAMKCRICENAKDNTEYLVPEMMYGFRDLFRYFQCARCGCLQIAEFPPDMSKYYRQGYYSHRAIGRPGILKRILTRLRDRYAVLDEGLIGRVLYGRFPAPPLRSLSFLKPSKDAHILDVGCGSGWHLRALRELGYRYLLGIDPLLDEDIRYDDGLTIQKKSIHEIQTGWDLIMFHHSFEHISDPEATLRRVHDLLNRGGHCMISQPTVSSYTWKHYGVNWVQLDAPRHFFLHSRESMEILAGKSGFELVNTIYDSTAFQFWGSEQYLRDIPLLDGRSYRVNPEDSIFSKEEIAGFARRAKELNGEGRGDQAVFYLKRTKQSLSG